MSKSKRGEFSQYFLDRVESHIIEKRRVTRINTAWELKAGTYRTADHLEELVKQGRIKTHDELCRGKVHTYYYALDQEFHNPTAIKQPKKKQENKIVYPNDRVRELVQRAVANLTETIVEPGHEPA